MPRPHWSLFYGIIFSLRELKLVVQAQAVDHVQYLWKISEHLLPFPFIHVQPSFGPAMVKRSLQLKD